METAVQLLVGGLAIGCVYSLLGLGFSMTIRALNLINFAQGDLAMLGGFLGFSLLAAARMPFSLAFILGVALTACAGYLIERVALRPILRRRSPPLNLVIAVLGLSAAMKSLAILLWGADPVAYPKVFPDKPLDFGLFHVHPLNLSIMAVGLALMVLLQWFFQRTITGISWRASSQDPMAAELMGASVKRTITLTFVLSAAMAGAAGMLVSPLYFVSYGMGFIGMKGFAAAAMGGFTMKGTMLGGLGLGIMETLGSGYVSAKYRDVIAYSILIIILMGFYKPKAPTGQSRSERARSVIDPVLAGRMSSAIARARVPLAVFAAAVWVWPLITGHEYSLHILILTLIYGIAALGLQLVTGFTGQISLGHAAFLGVGAYASSLMVMKLKAPFLLGVLVAGLASALVSSLVAPLLRLTGFYLAMGTLSLGQILYMLMNNWVWLTGGPYGINAVPYPQIFGFTFSSYGTLYVMMTVMFVVAYWVVRQLTTGQFGRSLVAVRENELASACSGVNLARQKALAFVIGSAMAGVSGALYAHFIGYISPEPFGLLASTNLLTMIVIGGLGSLPGALLGSLVVTVLPEYLRFLADYRTITYGLTLVVFMRFLPGGLVEFSYRLVEVLMRGLDSIRGARARRPRKGVGDIAQD